MLYVLGRSGIRTPRLKPYLSQTCALKIYTFHYLARCSALLRYEKDWFTQCQDNGTEWDIRSWCKWPGFPVGQDYKVTMSADCHKSVPILT